MVDEGVAYLRTLVAGFGCSTCLDPQVFVTLPFFPLHCVEPFTAAFSVFLLFSGGGWEGRKEHQNAEIYENYNIKLYIKLISIYI